MARASVSHMSEDEKILRRNIKIYSWYKIFTKRIYLPLVTIQLASVGKVSLSEMALMVIISSIIQAILQVPAGYIADKIGNRQAILMGATIAAPSPLFYAFMPNFWGGLIASVLFFAGYAFQSGAAEAFMHDTLKATGKENDYTKVLGRAQTYGLVGNTLLIILVPLTYKIHHSLPFLLGFISLCSLVLLASRLTYPPKVVEEHASRKKNPIEAMKRVITLQNVALFLFAGFLTGMSNKGSEFRELLFQDLGVAVAWFGVIAAAGNILGAVMGWYIHFFDRFRPLTFYMVDLLILAGCVILMGLTPWAWPAIAAVMIYNGYGRVRLIVLQSKMLTGLQHTYKATLLSALSMFTLLGDIAAITLVTHFVNQKGYVSGHLWFGLAALGIGFALWVVVWLESLRRRERKAARPVA